jgi:hypothetical protein
VRASLVALTAFLLLSLTALAGAQTCREQVFFDTPDGTIEITHTEALNNCCCTIEPQVLLEDYVLDVHEYEILEGGGCDCLCCFDIEVVVAGLEPGDYTVTIIKHTEYAGIEYLGPWIVTVTGECPPSVHSGFVPCVDTAVSDDEISWGVIKALYR